MLTYLTPRIVREFNGRCERDLGCTFRWGAFKRGSVVFEGTRQSRRMVAHDHADVYYLHGCNSRSDLTRAKAEAILVDVLADHVRESPELSQVGWREPEKLKCTPGNPYPRPGMATLTVPVWTGPVADEAVVHRLAYVRPLELSGIEEAEWLGTYSTAVGGRYAIGERVIVSGQKSKPEASTYYFVCSYRRPSGIGGYLLVKEVVEPTYRNGRRHRTLTVDYAAAMINGRHSWMWSRHFTGVMASKIEKFYPEEDR